MGAFSGHAGSDRKCFQFALLESPSTFEALPMPEVKGQYISQPLLHQLGLDSFFMTLANPLTGLKCSNNLNPLCPQKKRVILPSEFFKFSKTLML